MIRGLARKFAVSFRAHLSPQGFTLVELLVIIFIISLFSVMVLFNHRNLQESLALERASFQVAQDIRRVEEMAIAAQKFNGSYPSGGFGIQFTSDSQTYIIFADLDEDQTYDGGSELVETKTLEAPIKVSNLLPSSPLTIIFKAPDPEVILPGGVSEVTIEVVSPNSQSKTIFLNKSGTVEIK